MTRIQATDETRFNHSARLVVVFALAILALDIAQLAYRFTLPTEGWAHFDSDIVPNAQSIPMLQNIVGAPSPLQVGDALQSIAGLPIAQILNTGKVFTPPSGWEAGGRVSVTVLRDGQLLTFDIPIINWTFAAWWRNNLADLSRLVSWLTMLTLLGVGLFTFLNRPRNLAARFLFLFGLTGFILTLSGSLPDALGLYFNYPAILAKGMFSNVIFAYLLGPSLLGFALTFPQPKTFIQRHPGWLVVPYLVGTIPPIFLFTAPSLAGLGFPLTFAMILLTIAALVHTGLTVRDAMSRAQLRWAVGGVVVGLALFTLTYGTFLITGLLQEIVRVIAQLGLPVIGLSLAMAILRYRLFDIDLIIRRTLQYSVLSGLLGLTYFGLVIVLQNLLSVVNSQPSEFVTVLSTLAIAALFFPLRNRVQEFIDKRFYRKKYDAQKVLAEFAATCRDETDLDKLVARLVEVIDETLQPEKVSVWIKNDTKLKNDRADY